MNGAYRRGTFLARAAAVALAGIAGIASAASPGFYVSGSYGQSSAGMDSLDPVRLRTLMLNAWHGEGFNIFTWSDTKLDKSDQGFEIALGYRFSPFVAVEGGYIDLGDVTYDLPVRMSTDGTDFSEGVTSIAAGRNGPALSLIGTWPATRSLSLDAHAGAFFGESTAKVTYALAGQSPSQVKSSDRKTSAFVGAGVNWSLSQKTAIRLGYTHFTRGALIHHDVSRISLGVRMAL
jgi:hypothetical protein